MECSSVCYFCLGFELLKQYLKLFYYILERNCYKCYCTCSCGAKVHCFPSMYTSYFFYTCVYVFRSYFEHLFSQSFSCILLKNSEIYLYKLWLVALLKEHKFCFYICEFFNSFYVAYQIHPRDIKKYFTNFVVKIALEFFVILTPKRTNFTLLFSCEY